MTTLRKWPIVGATILAAGGAHAAADDAARRFGVRDNVTGVSVSPDGTALAVLQPAGTRGAIVSIVRLKGPPTLKPILSSTGSPDRLSFCRWASDERLVCGIYLIGSVYGERRGVTRLVTLNADGSDVKQLSARGSERTLGVALGGGDVIDWLGDTHDGSVMMARTFIPETTTGSLIAEQRRGLGVERVDTRTLARRTVEAPNGRAISYITDGHGKVRIMALQPTTSTGQAKDRIEYRYRRRDSRDWAVLSEQVLSGGKATGFEPVAVDPDLDVAYGFEGKDGHVGVYKIALDGSLKKELVFGRPDADVDELIQVGRQDRVVGASWVTDKRQTAMFDPQAKQLAASLSKALPGTPNVSLVDASADEQKLVLFAGSDTDPGRFYLFDKATRKLAEILPVRPNLVETKLATVKPISFPAGDGTMIPGYLTLPPGSDGKNLPAIVLPHGGPWARDEWTFDYLSQFFANRGYAVLQPNYRGSTGYGESWFLNNGFRSWRTAIGDIDDGGRWLVKTGIADPAHLAIVGWSYGGYAALQSAVVEPALFKAVVAVAPVTDFEQLRKEWAGNATAESLDATFGTAATAQEASPARHADRIAVPVLLFHGDLDQNVGIAESRLMASRLQHAGKRVQFVEFKGLDHFLEDDDARTKLLGTADTFLRNSLGMTAQ